MRKGLIIQLLAPFGRHRRDLVRGRVLDRLAAGRRGAKEAERIDDLYVVTSIICLVIFALVAAVSIYALVKFRVPDDDEEDGKPIHGNTRLEIVWTAIPTALVDRDRRLQRRRAGEERGQRRRPPGDQREGLAVRVGVPVPGAR